MSALTRELERLRREVEYLRSDAIGLGAAVDAVRNTILACEGKEITPELADERARNIIAALSGLRIGGSE